MGLSDLFQLDQSNMAPTNALFCIIHPALTLLPQAMDSKAAEVLLLAIALQESRLVYRRQTNGPARGYWQFERVGIAGVLTHHVSRQHAEGLCAELGYRADADVLHAAIEHNDLLACGLARLLLYTDPAPLPRSADDAWDYYLRLWRPGRPHPDAWPENYDRAQQTAT